MEDEILDAKSNKKKKDIKNDLRNSQTETLLYRH